MTVKRYFIFCAFVEAQWPRPCLFIFLLYKYGLFLILFVSVIPNYCFFLC